AKARGLDAYGGLQLRGKNEQQLEPVTIGNDKLFNQINLSEPNVQGSRFNVSRSLVDPLEANSVNLEL
ncbi:MAG TPA: hypothetical protein VGB09_00765, partial [Candidatus Binatia bacterium]